MDDGLQTVNLTVVAEGLGFPEGPVVTADGTLYFVDIRNGTLMRLAPGAAPEQVAVLGGGPNGMAIGPDGCAYICNNGGVFDFTELPPNPSTAPRDRNSFFLLPGKDCPGQAYQAAQKAAPPPPPGQFRGMGSIQRVNLATGEVTELFGPATGHNLIAPDDIVFDAHGPAGSFWFTDCGFQNDTLIRKGAVYAAHTDGRFLQPKAKIPSPNGIGFSPDGGTLYVSDTLSGRLWALPVQPADPAKPARDLVLPFEAAFQGAVVLALSPGPQWLDSLKVEQGGQVCLGTLLSGGITLFDPATGATAFLPVGTPLPDTPSGKGDPFTSNLCFGGPDMRQVWITASSTGKIYHGLWPRPGLKPAFPA